MITLTNLRFFDEYSQFVVEEDFAGLVFANEDLVQVFIDHRTKYWQSVFMKPLRTDPRYNETIKMIEINKIIRFVAWKLGIPVSSLKSKSRKRELVDARRFAMQICADRGMTAPMIADQMGFDRTTILHHLKDFSDLIEYNNDVAKAYYEISDYVMFRLNGQFSQDGSGKLLKPPEE